MEASTSDTCIQPEFHDTGDHANSLPAAADSNIAVAGKNCVGKRHIDSLSQNTALKRRMKHGQPVQAQRARTIL